MLSEGETMGAGDETFLIENTFHDALRFSHRFILSHKYKISIFQCVLFFFQLRLLI